MTHTGGPGDVHLGWGAQAVTLRWRDAQGAPQQRALPIGLQQLVQRHRFGRPVNALALEAAIESIEDAVMPLAPAMPPGATLVLHPDAAPEGLAQALAAPGFGLETVEAAFARLADLALDRPAAQAGVPDAPDFAAGLLVVREAMHHLGLHRGRWARAG